MTREQELAWCGGLFDGEGTIHFSKKNRLMIKVNMTHIPTVIKFRKIIGYGNISFTCPKKPKRKKYCTFTLSSHNDCKKFLETIQPYLLTKSEECNFTIDLCKTLEYMLSHPYKETLPICKYAQEILIYLKSIPYYNEIFENFKTEEFNNYKTSNKKIKNLKNGHKILVKCLICNKEFYNSNIGKKTYYQFCSNKCRAEKYLTNKKIKCNPEILENVRSDALKIKNNDIIGIKYQISRETVRRWTKKDEYGNYLFKIGQYDGSVVKRRFSKEDRDKIYYARKSGMSLIKIKDQFGCSTSYVTKICKNKDKLQTS